MVLLIVVVRSEWFFQNAFRLKNYRNWETALQCIDQNEFNTLIVSILDNISHKNNITNYTTNKLFHK